MICHCCLNNRVLFLLLFLLKIFSFWGQKRFRGGQKAFRGSLPPRVAESQAPRLFMNVIPPDH